MNISNAVFFKSKLLLLRKYAYKMCSCYIFWQPVYRQGRSDSSITPAQWLRSAHLLNPDFFWQRSKHKDWWYKNWSRYSRYCSYFTCYEPCCIRFYLPYERYYNPWFIFFQPTFWGSKTIFLRSIQERFLIKSGL